MKFVLVALLVFPLSSIASIPKTKDLIKPSNILAGSSAVQGGKSGPGFSLIAAQRMTLKGKNIERVAIEFGDLAMQKIAGQPGYFHAELKSGNRLVINFSQLHFTKFSEKDLKNSMAKSAFVRNIEMIKDPENKNLSMIINLEQKAKVRVTPMRGDGIKTSRVLFDFYLDKKNR